MLRDRHICVIASCTSGGLAPGAASAAGPGDHPARALSCAHACRTAASYL